MHPLNIKVDGISRCNAVCSLRVNACELAVGLIVFSAGTICCRGKAKMPDRLRLQGRKLRAADADVGAGERWIIGPRMLPPLCGHLDCGARETNRDQALRQPFHGMFQFVTVGFRSNLRARKSPGGDKHKRLSH